MTKIHFRSIHVSTVLTLIKAGRQILASFFVEKMTNAEQFQGRTDEAIATLKEKAEKIEKKVGDIDKKIWAIILLLITVLVNKAPDFTNSLIHTVIAWGGK